MAQGKFSKPRTRSTASEPTQRPPVKQHIPAREEPTLLHLEAEAPILSDSTVPVELSDHRPSQLNTEDMPEAEAQEALPADALPEAGDIPGEAAQDAPPVYNQELRQVHRFRQPEPPQDTEQDEAEDPPTLTERVMEFVDGHRKTVLAGLAAAAAVLILSVVLIVFFSVGGSPEDPYGNRILNNVMVAGVNVGGMTRSEAVSAVKRATSGTFTKQDMVVQFSEKTLYLSPKNTKVKLDVPAAVDAAFAYGRTGTQAEQQKDYQNSLTGNHTIGLLPYLDLDTDYIRQALEEYAGAYAGQFTQSSYTLEGDAPDLSAEGFDETTPCQTLVLYMGTPGFGLDINELYAQILDAYSMNEFLVEVGDVPENAVPEPLDLDSIYTQVYIAPVDAYLDRSTYQTVPGTYGYDFDLEEAKALLSGCQYGDTLRISLRYIAPAGEDTFLFQDVLGSCETPHTSNENRNTNLRLACKALDGLVLNPGETFSYNETLGQRTAEKGYMMAPAYSGQELTDSLGGGICQGSSTLYYCALLADMEIVERVNHGFPASYIDLGMDATVNWGSPDLKFKNTSDYPVKIEAEVSDGYVKMKILGTDTRDYYVKMEYEVTGSQEPTVVYKEYKPGEGYTDGQVLQEGKSAIYVKSYKLKYSKETDQLISKDFEARSHYQSKDRIIVRIVQEETVPPTTTAPETTSPPATTAPPAATAPPVTTQPATEATTQATTEATTQATTEATTQATTEATNSSDSSESE